MISTNPPYGLAITAALYNCSVELFIISYYFHVAMHLIFNTGGARNSTMLVSSQAFL